MLTPINLSIDNWIDVCEFLWFEDLCRLQLVDKYINGMLRSKLKKIHSFMLQRLLAKIRSPFKCESFAAEEVRESLTTFALKLPEWPSQMVGFSHILVL